VSPELRIDPLSGLRVIVAGERGSRPGAFLEAPERRPIDLESDPFAAGHEDRTPP
jgi:UDPglucose--hexose-1-phosphate uridylyltransferase